MRSRRKRRNEGKREEKEGMRSRRKKMARRK
jgi:hypothetical protein